MKALWTLIFLTAAAAPLRAQRSLVIQRFDATITVNRDGSLDVVEEIVPRFTGSWNGIFRTIPIDYHTPQGFNWSLYLDLVSVTDGDGNGLRVESSRERHYRKFKIYVPGAVNATRTVILRYHVRNGLRYFEDYDELYWNVTGDEWEVPIESATAGIVLPDSAEGVRAIAFNGAYGSTAQEASVVIEGPTVRVAMPHGLAFHEGLTAVVGWNKGLVARPGKDARAWWFLRSNWPLAIPIVAFVLMFLAWRRWGRDPKALPVPVQYEPPPGLSPAEAGTLMDNSADMRDITATMIDLAVRGHLRIEETEEKKLFGLFSSKEFVFHRLEGPREPLAPHETRVLQGIFADGERVELSDLENEFYASLPGIKNAIFDRLVSHGMYRKRPDTVQRTWVLLAIVAGIILVVAGGMVAARFNMTPLPFIVSGILVAIIVLVFGILMPARTTAGARSREKIMGFEEFMRRVDSDRYKRMPKTPEMFERCLPYAMAFGVEKQWAKAFEDIFVEPPRWYVGPSPMSFSAGDFSNRMSALSTAAGQTMASSPRSSGGSGFGGGGSSGGGGGGGGGGGF